MKGNIPNIEHPQNVAARRTMGLFDILFSSMVHANAVQSCEKPNIADAVPLLFDSENGFNAKFVVSGKSIPKKNIVANRKSAKRIRLFKKCADAKNAPSIVSLRQTQVLDNMPTCFVRFSLKCTRSLALWKGNSRKILRKTVFLIQKIFP